jgi:tRNA splicing ligase
VSRIDMEKDSIMIVLVGIPGCGKSTYAKELIQLFSSCSASNTDDTQKWVSHNQDVLKTRKAVMSRTEKSLKMKQRIIIDRCNFDSVQRFPWIDIGEKYKVSNILCVVMPDYRNVKFCSMRAIKRGDDGIHAYGDTTDWTAVCHRMNAALRYPTLSEGFTAIYHCWHSTAELSTLLTTQCKQSQSSFTDVQEVVEDGEAVTRC